MRKLNGRHHLRYGSIPSSHAINSLLDSQYTKNHPPHKAAISKLTDKQRSNLKSPIKDINECLNSVKDCYNLLFPLFSPGSRVVNHFSSRFSFHSPPSSSNEDLFHYLQNLDQAFRSSQTSSHNITIIADGGIKKSQVATTVSWLGKMAKSLSIFLFFSFSFLLSWTYYTEESAGKCHVTSVTQSQSHDRKSQHHITWCHMMSHMIGVGK